MLGTHYLLTAMQLPRINESDVRMLERTFTHAPGNMRELFFELTQHRSQLQSINNYRTGTWLRAEEAADSLEEFCAQYRIAITTIEDADYPEHLRYMPKPPLVLFSRGDKGLLDSTGIAITGSAQPTEYGQKCARRIGEVVGSLGLTVTGGLQCGSASIAHRGCLKGLGKTTAIAAGPLPSPEMPQPLAEEIIDMGGLLVSAKAPGSSLYDPVEAARITVGLSRALLVVEYDPASVLRHMVGFATFAKKSVATLYEREHFPLDREHLPRGMEVLEDRKELEVFLNSALHTHYRLNTDEKQLSLHA